MQIEVNITPMSMKNGVLGLPIRCCREWNASKSVDGILEYAGRKSQITFSPKHIDVSRNTAKAWQFTVNDSVQFNQLKMDGVFTYVEEAVSGEKLICEFSAEEGYYLLKVIDVAKKPETKATKKIKEFLKQGIREKSHIQSKAPLWNSPSEWIDSERMGEYTEVQDCLYIWAGSKYNSQTTYLYVGIVGDTKSEGRSKRNLTQRLKEEQKKFQKEYGIKIKCFRYCSLNSAQEAVKNLVSKEI